MQAGATLPCPSDYCFLLLLHVLNFSSHPLFLQNIVKMTKMGLAREKAFGTQWSQEVSAAAAAERGPLRLVRLGGHNRQGSLLSCGWKQFRFHKH